MQSVEDDTLAAQVHAALLARGLTVASAESLTGGALGDLLSSTSGASATYRGGVVTYATELKAQLLGVDRVLLGQVGAVHPKVVEAMAEGAARVLHADYAVATTGVAGPTPQDGRRPGTVFVGVRGPGGVQVFDESLDVDGPTPLDRETIRRTTTLRAVRRVRDVVREDVANADDGTLHRQERDAAAREEPAAGKR
jgi:PncC family amidohydrolase